MKKGNLAGSVAKKTQDAYTEKKAAAAAANRASQ